MSYQITDLCNGCTACTRICPVSAIQGEKKAVHKVDESACIDCGACGRMCPRKAIVDPSGQSCVPIKLTLWPKPVFQESVCSSCRICSEGCPMQCISMKGDAKDKRPRPFLADPKRCISCGFCEEDCPLGIIVLNTTTVEQQPEAI